MTEEEQIEEMTELVRPFADGKVCEHESGSCEFTTCRSCNALNAAKTLYSKDYRKVRRGTWKRGESNGKPYAMCTACGLRMNSNCYGYPYCNLCGARMDGDR